MTRDPYPFSILSVNQKDGRANVVQTPFEGCVDLTSVFIFEQCLDRLSIQGQACLSCAKPLSPCVTLHIRCIRPYRAIRLNFSVETTTYLDE